MINDYNPYTNSWLYFLINRFHKSPQRKIFCRLIVENSRMVQGRVTLSDHLCITVKDYIHLKTSKMQSKPGQPIEQFVFHRPIREYFNLLLTQGIVMTGFEEPSVNPKLLPIDSLWGHQRAEIPPVLISRC